MATVLQEAMRKSQVALRAQAARRKQVQAHLKRQETRRANLAAVAYESRKPVVTAWFEGARATALCVMAAGPYAREFELSVSLPMAWEGMPYESLRTAMIRAVTGVMWAAELQDSVTAERVVRAAFEQRGW